MHIETGYTFDDLLLIPKHSNILSRSDVDLSVDLGKNIKLDIPIVSANMRNVTGPTMAAKIASLKGLAVLHRFHDSAEERLSDYGKALQKTWDIWDHCEQVNIAFSVGVQPDEKNIIDAFADYTVYTDNFRKIICIDVAHGDSKACLNTTEYIAKKHPDILLIAGNVATSDGAYNLYNAGADVVKVGVGPGCFIAGTRILMSNGVYKNIEDIVVGDRVINKNGQSVNVTDAFSTGIRRVSKIRHTLSHKPTYATSDHKFWVGDLNSISETTLKNSGYVKQLDKQSKTIPRQSKYKWKEIGSCKQDCFLLPNNIEFELESYFKIELYKRDGGNGRDNKKKLDTVIEPSYKLGYLFGTFLGDGHAMCAKYNNSKIGAVNWYFGKKEKDIANKLSNAVEYCIGKSPVIKEKDNITQVTLYYKPLADFLFKFDKKTSKHLPSEYLVNNKEYLQGILDGLVDSDGHTEKDGRIRFTNTSEQLVELFGVVNYLLTGVFPNQQMRSPTVGGLKNVDVKNCNDGYVSGILSTSHKRLTKDYQVAKMLEIQDIKIDATVYDITVDCDTHSFIANNAIVHNSLCTTRVETGNGVPQLTALNNVYSHAKKHGFKVIADGGLKNGGDITKALCFSHCVMLGNILAGTNEAPGDIITTDKGQYKQYAGSSTHKSNHVEGVVGLVPYKGPVTEVIKTLLEGVRSGLSYQGAHNLTELRRNPKFISISHAGLIESKPHSVLVK